MVSGSSLSIVRKLCVHCVRKLFVHFITKLVRWEARGGGGGGGGVLELCSAPSGSSIPQSVLPSWAWELLAYPLFILTMSVAGDEEAEGHGANTGWDDLPTQHRGTSCWWNGGWAMDTAQSRSVAGQHRWCRIQAMVTVVCLFVTVYWGSSYQDGTWSLIKNIILPYLWGSSDQNGTWFRVKKLFCLSFGGVYVPCIYLLACQVRVTVSDSGLCCCVRVMPVEF